MHTQGERNCRRRPGKSSTEPWSSLPRTISLSLRVFVETHYSLKRKQVKLALLCILDLLLKMLSFALLHVSVLHGKGCNRTCPNLHRKIQMNPHSGLRYSAVPLGATPRAVRLSSTCPLGRDRHQGRASTLLRAVFLVSRGYQLSKTLLLLSY